MSTRRVLCALVWAAFLGLVPQSLVPQSSVAAESAGIFARENLVAWCIVPFDSKKRGPEERAAMLERLGLKKLAYDYRAEHVPTFDAELDALKSHGIELTAWWFPGSLNDEARQILAVLKRHHVKTQLWVTGGGGPTTTPKEFAERVKSEAARIRPIAEAAADIGCSVGLYNHGGWFGEPENQLAIIEELKLPNVGIVYNQHHGHDHVARFAELLRKMQPHLYVLNLNGMVEQGDKKGQKIVPLGAGELDLGLLKVIQDSGYRGPIGILNHTDHDAEARLRDNLDGLAWLLPQLDGKTPDARPKWRTWTVADSAPSAALPTAAGNVLEGRAEYRQPPITVEVVAALTQNRNYNILLASDTKASGAHWELFTMAGSGRLTAYLPGFAPDHVRSEVDVCDGRQHHLALILEPERARLLVDGRLVADQSIGRTNRSEVPGGVGIGRLVEGGLTHQGEIAWARISKGTLDLSSATTFVPKPAEATLLLWQPTAPATSQQIPTAPPFDPSLVSATLASSRKGDAGRGAMLFASAKLACLSCHKIGEHGGAVGPELTAIGSQRTPEQLVESVFWPKREVKPEYSTWTVVTSDGKSLRGYKVREDAESFVLRDPSLRTDVTIAVGDIDEKLESGTLMPEGLLNSLTESERQDLIRFVTELGRPGGPSLESINSILARTRVHAPTPFPYERAPLHPQDWPSWQHPVNRDRIYDFYAKQAEHFRKESHLPPLLTEYPGLDGGVLGHWGNQKEETWADDRWNETILGTVQGGIFRGAGVTVPRGICVRLGEKGELAACFNPETLTYDAVWKNGFVSFSSVRHGFMHGLQLQGEPVKIEAEKPSSEPFEYHGFYRSGMRVAFAYRRGNVEYLDAPWVADGTFQREVASVSEHSLRGILQGGDPQWPQTMSVTGELGSGRPYAIDNIPLPFENPWKALMFCGDHDFLPDGSALVCTMQGDVWHATGINGDLKHVTWRRFASGLHHCLGLVVAEGRIYVLGRDQITRLHDLNHDGEADFYECFSRAYQTSPAGHDFICGLQRDAEGKFYTASGNQGLVKISKDGKRAEVLATGFRNPDGLCVLPDGTVTVPCSEGDWTPSSMICAVRPGITASTTGPTGGHQPPFFGWGGPRKGRGPDLPLVYIPRGLDNSSGGQVVVDSERWGPLEGQLIHFSFGAGTSFLVLRDEVGGQLQGGLVPLPGEFLSGAHRGRFNPLDGQLYVTGMAGWGSYTPRDGCFQRVRYTGDRVQLPVAFHAYQNGVSVTFSQPVDPALAENAANQFAQCWNYRYSAGYGSAEFSSRHYGSRGHDSLTIPQVCVLPDGKSLFVELPELQPVNQLHLHLTVDGGRPHDLFLTVHQLDAPFLDDPRVKAITKTVAPHPIVADLALATSRVLNPYLKRNSQARPITIEAGKNLTFTTRSFAVKAGEPIRLTLLNPDVVPHNWALLKPGTLQSVGELTNRQIADPDAVARHYIPKSSDVLYYTDIVLPQDEFSIWFKAPETPGRYPYLCTFPGHWMVMNGEMVVE